MKTKQEIIERIKGLMIVKDADLKRIGIDNPEHDQIKNGFEVEIKALKWVLN